ncbi:NADPH-dependent FMN reductase [Sphingomonas cavernae]|uniref:NADPH-dependent oxidoreductase n=1 Tax=Sphingomonas cavernae TaxID=2320861 RepID=A0A418WQN5_9SPHN|nr:NAD(P)H-dependent oxidoreductase [Sphingomonas cavernae]RJF93564.1 NADPH-dependent oxidoreductase [Sphingomonas cavernae]
MHSTLDIALIYGSTREARLCDTVVRWAAGEIAARRDIALEIIDPREDVAGSDTLGARIEAADGYIVVTPEYNHGYPAALKALLDSADEQWSAKPVAFISYGGVSGGLRAVEQLRLVCAELNMVTVREQLSFANVWEQFGANGALYEPDRARRALAAMLDALGWWGSVLRDARATLPRARAA